jgi:hypothetical protein
VAAPAPPPTLTATAAHYFPLLDELESDGDWPAPDAPVEPEPDPLAPGDWYVPRSPEVPVSPACPAAPEPWTVDPLEDPDEPIVCWPAWIETAFFCPAFSS